MGEREQAALDGELATARQELAAVQLRALAVAEQLEAAATRIAADESERSRLRAQLQESEAAALRIKGQRDHLQEQVASLKQHRRLLEKRYRLVRVLGPAGFAAIKISDRVGALRRARRRRRTER